MINKTIELELREALVKLYDPNFQPTENLLELLGCDNNESNVAVQSKIIEVIENLIPGFTVPQSSPTVKYYNILHNRFVLRLTLEETALRMNMSLSSTWRDQRAAIHFLATEVWRQNQEKTNTEEKEEDDKKNLNLAGSEMLPGQSPNWTEQTRRELASLQTLAPDAISEVGVLVNQVVELERNLCDKRGVKLEVGPIKPDLFAVIHPSVFRQILIVAISRFLRHMDGGKITLFGRMEDGNVKVTVAGMLDMYPEDFEQMLRGELPLPKDSSVEIYREGGRIFLWIKLPALADHINVLVVDDNIDMIHYYQRSTEGTSYRIVPLERDQDLFSTIQKNRPDIILLDVMLPGIDGWELLMQIRANPLTRSIPVIICSVVKEEELALSLGAARFISKPVNSQDIVQALDQVLSRAP